MFPSFLDTLYGQDSRNNSEVIFCFLNSHMRLVEIKEGQQFKFFASDAIDVYANKFKTTDKIVFTYAK